MQPATSISATGSIDRLLCPMSVYEDHAANALDSLNWKEGLREDDVASRSVPPFMHVDVPANHSSSLPGKLALDQPVRILDRPIPHFLY